jgi:AsmA protein
MSVTISQGTKRVTKRVGLPVLAVLFALAVITLASTLLLNRETLRRAVETQIRDVTGLDIVVGGPVDISLFPASYVAFHQVGLKGNGDPDAALAVDSLTANLRLLPLLMRRFEIADLMMLRPKINVTRHADGTSNWTPFIDNLTRNLKPGGTPLSFSEIRIQDGVLVFKDADRNLTETVGDIDLSLAWPSISRSFAATGQFDWRGERIDGSVSVSDFVAALSGERSGVKARLASAPLKIAFDGAVANKTSLLMEGTLAADSPALRSALRWAGATPPGAAGFGRFSLKGRASLVGASLALTNVNVELDGNSGEGVMTYNIASGRPSLQATLAAGTLDFTPYVQTVRLLSPGARDWNRQLFDLGILGTTDIDMRLSAAKLTIGTSMLGRTALGANLKNGTLSLSVGEAQMCGGVVKGTLGFTNNEALADVKAQFQLADVDLQSCAGELLGNRKISGRGTLSVMLEATGANAFALASSLDGSATLAARDGAISGFNAEQLLKRLERRPLSGGGNFRSGQTPFSSLNMNVKFADGIATVSNLALDGPSAKLRLSGTSSVPQRDYDLKGVASLAGTSDGFELPFLIQGPWEDPLIFPDPDALLRRSPATAPLLDAVKDRKTRDAVRSVIERITGKTQEPAAETTSGTPAGPGPAAQ